MLCCFVLCLCILAEINRIYQARIRDRALTRHINKLATKWTWGTCKGKQQQQQQQGQPEEPEEPARANNSWKQKQIFEWKKTPRLIHKMLPGRVKILWGNEDVSLWPIKKAFVPGNIPNCGKLPEKFPSLGSGQIYYSGWWRERSQGDFTNPTTQVPPPKKIQQSSQVENTRKHFLAKHLPFIKKNIWPYFCQIKQILFFSTCN